MKYDFNKNSDRLEFLRTYADPDLPDIYNLHVFKPNGCGPEKIAGLIPDSLPGVPDWSVAGDYHDYAYFVGGESIDRMSADLALRALMIKAVEVQLIPPGSGLLQEQFFRIRHFIAMRRIKRIAALYYRAVRIGGVKYFNWTHIE